jgi:hypothetical protein
MTAVRFPAGAGNSSLRLRVQTSAGAHPTSHPVGIEVSFPEEKAVGCEANHSPPPSVEAKNAWSYTSTVPYVFVAWYLVKYSDNFTLLYTCISEGALMFAYPLLHKMKYKSEKLKVDLNVDGKMT